MKDQKPVVSSWLSPEVEKRRDGVSGIGLFAKVDLAAAALIAVKGGHLVDRSQLDELPEVLYRTHSSIAPGIFLCALQESECEGVMIAMNHSCQPNVCVHDLPTFRTLRPVAANEELTTDYSWMSPITRNLICECASRGCRKVITPDDWHDIEFRIGAERHGSWQIRDLIRQNRDSSGHTVVT